MHNQIQKGSMYVLGQTKDNVTHTELGAGIRPSHVDKLAYFLI